MLASRLARLHHSHVPHLSYATSSTDPPRVAKVDRAAFTYSQRVPSTGWSDSTSVEAWERPHLSGQINVLVQRRWAQVTTRLRYARSNRPEEDITTDFPRRSRGRRAHVDGSPRPRGHRSCKKEELILHRSFCLSRTESLAAREGLQEFRHCRGSED